MTIFAQRVALAAALVILLPVAASAATAAAPQLSGMALVGAIFTILWGPLNEVLALVYPDPKVNSIIQAIGKIAGMFLPKKP